jgi:predicted DsbA family dithiol-disulfide isomerase
VLVEVWSDVVCPWCYLGKRRFEAALAAFEHADEVVVRWRSYELDPSAPARRTRSMPELVARRYGLAAEEAAARLGALDRVARAEGLAFDLARTQGGNTFDAHRVLHLAASVDADLAATLEEALLHAYFIELRAIGDRAVVVDVAGAVGLDPADVRAVLESDRFADDVRADEAEAAALGCTGVPFFVLDRAFAVPGAQDAATFLRVLRRVRERGRAARAHGPAPVERAAADGPADSSG